jgi:hypothetical protein
MLKSVPRAARPPADLRSLLAATDERGRMLYGLVRRLVDELEAAAPWSMLYAPPAELGDLRTRLRRLLELVEEAPRRIQNELDGLATSVDGTAAREAREEAEFYFAALHQMTASNRRLLGAALEQVSIDAPLSRSGADYLCELAADLEGKYSSSMMGAAAALVSDGRWLGVEVEAVLFPEKAEERTRNRELLTALEEATQALAAVRAGFSWRPVLESWRARRQVDRYTLSDLVSLRSTLLPLLTVAHRRALYSGDYHHLQRREILLGSRLRELEELHLSSLDVAPGALEAATGEIYPRLCQLLSEIAALLDVEVLRDLIGNEAVGQLREGSASAATSNSAAPELDPLALLLGEEDLALFLELLLGAVRKRSSIVFEAGEFAASRPAEAEPQALPEAKAAIGRRTRGAVRLDTPAIQRLGDQLVATLSRLTSPASERWRAFQMVHKLQIRLRVLPPALTAEMMPFLAELRSDLLPLLEEAGTAGVLPASAAETLRSCDQRLSRRDLSSLETSLEVGGDLGRVLRLLPSLEAAAAALRLHQGERGDEDGGRR